MASTINIQSTINHTAPLLKFMPNNVGPTQEPALTNANIVLATILGPPFRWRWNRKVATFNTTANVQDYVVVVSDFGFIEKAEVNDNLGNADSIHELSMVKLLLSKDASKGRPEAIAAQLDDGAGNITFRLQPGKPGAIFTITITYQARPALITSVASFWNPIPDEYVHVFDSGFLAHSLKFRDDSRFQTELQRFAGHLLAVSEGLSEVEKNLFLDSINANQVASHQIRTQQGHQGRTQ
jgi:hypothetical protein